MYKHQTCTVVLLEDMYIPTIAVL